MSDDVRTTQQEARQKEFAAKAGTELFDLLAMELPEPLARRVVFARCPHCKRRPELIKRERMALYVPLRPYSAQTVRIDGYEVIPCCSAVYDPNRVQTTISRLQVRRAREKAGKTA